MSWLTPEELYLFNEGRYHRAYEKMGAHFAQLGGKKGVWFSVWAPNVKRVSAVGDFNGWDTEKGLLEPLENSGIWSAFIPGAKKGQTYKFRMETLSGHYVEKADPFSFWSEDPPRTASKISDINYSWKDKEWMQTRKDRQAASQAISIYEVHLGSWRRNPSEGNRSLTYRELAEELPAYVKEMKFTHVEMMPVMEHPFYGSWGYQTTSYFSPSGRYGSPEDFMFLVDRLHQEGIGVILDWVPSHFPADDFALANFTGGPLFEHADPRLGFHPEWKSLIFNYGRREVRSFLISSAMYWLDRFHVDGIRVDAVASMLYLDYSRKPGEWVPNMYGGHENLEAVHFLKELNESVYKAYPDIHMIAEESTAWPKVSAPTFAGGLGFDMKWDMGWMHDTFQYFQKDPVYRKYHQNDLTFRSLYAFSENFVLSISHDEVVYGKGSVLNKMSGDEWQKFANLRVLYAYMFALPGKKLLFMGSEFAQGSEWNHDSSLDWHLLQYPSHRGISFLVRYLNHIYRNESALHELDFSADGFEWLDAQDSDHSIISFYRKNKKGEEVLCAFNMTPVPQYGYHLGVNTSGFWKEILSTDATDYGGSGMGNMGGVEAESIPTHNRKYSLRLTLPPLGAVFLKAGRI
ncbi:MAG TPA: 1,4-alpha-glucan branching protein GlgB [Bdellovibrio sp.]|uniref:1,4-alpha-glucan branching protein GlgB n=1 Tax=Bdellovibrio sp. TaxID=28201 RepID=UPI002F09F512